uniref:Uncharacterized protein n=1 Tax=Sipha flava TaxID=143950 RepID=A0A2S2QZG3_9HEMI
MQVESIRRRNHYNRYTYATLRTMTDIIITAIASQTFQPQSSATLPCTHERSAICVANNRDVPRIIIFDPYRSCNTKFLKILYTFIGTTTVCEGLVLRVCMYTVQRRKCK